METAPPIAIPGRSAVSLHQPGDDKAAILEARDIVKDLFEPNPRIYWTDMLLTATIAYASLAAFPRLPAGWEGLKPFLFVTTALAFYRLAIFNHEVSHFRTGTFRWFTNTWNFLCGIPLLMPSFFYDTHRDHHRKNAYGTHDDGEYLPLAKGPLMALFWYLAQVPLLPIAYVFRFLVCTPLTFLFPKTRPWVVRHLSSMVMDLRFERPIPSAKEMQWWWWVEAACFALTLGGAIGLFTGLMPADRLLRLYLTACCVLGLNSIRTLAAHRFRNVDGHEMSTMEQLLDSVNITGNRWLTPLWAPLGLQYHALHHLFPSIPYHNLHEAHTRLMRDLPADSPYRQTVSPSLWTTLKDLWRDASTAAKANAAAKTNAAPAPASQTESPERGPDHRRAA